MSHSKWILVFAVCFLVATAFAGTQWMPVGPDGGDARSLAFDPHNPDHLYLGTSAGKLFVSNDGGASWTRLAHLGNGDDYVLDNIAIDPKNSMTIFVGAWSVENNSGDVFRSNDGGKTWTALDGMKGHSIRALEIAPSDSKALVVGALDGVFRSKDAGDTWERITPANHADLKNFESVAIDPLDPEKIYAGTWHLPWRTTDGGKTWAHMNKGIIDDSDVFSIIVDPRNPSIVFASACSGIYKSTTTGMEFKKVQGIPFSARRTRVLQQDPASSDVVYAGTTEGLWKSVDAGVNWKRMTGPNVIVNDVFVDPRNPARVLIATDRSGVLASTDGATTFVAANRGFAHRQITALAVDRTRPGLLFASMINDHEFGGVYASRDAGLSWIQTTAGLGGTDVFQLRQTANGTLLAGTNHGIFALSDPGKSSSAWSPRNAYLIQKSQPRATKSGGTAKMVSTPTLVRSELNARVSDLDVSGDVWFAATSVGLLMSENQGASWKGGAVLTQSDFVGVRSSGKTVVAITPKVMVVSLDQGINWYGAHLPRFITLLRDVEIDPAGGFWIATREGLWRSADGGDNWEHVFSGLPATFADAVHYDTENRKMVALSKGTIYESADGGRHWQSAEQQGWNIRGIASAPGRRYAFTAYDGILSETELSARTVGSSVGASGANQ